MVVVGLHGARQQRLNNWIYPARVLGHVPDLAIVKPRLLHASYLRGEQLSRRMYVQSRTFLACCRRLYKLRAHEVFLM